MTVPIRSDSGPGQLTFELGHTPSLGVVDFLVGDGNRLAYERIMAFPDWPDPVTLVTGPAASGKSHLARVFADRSGAETVVAADMDRLAQVGGRAPLIVEDADRGGYDEVALFHLLNQSMREQRPLLLTAREPVGSWPLGTDDVRSRVRRAASFTLAVTDDIQLSQMFVKLFGDRQIMVDPKVIFYMVARMERSAEEVVILADLVDRLALAKGSAISRTIAADALNRRRLERGDTGQEQDWDTDDE
jgi:chromosomal replication initiation ATPase DnaA